MAELARAAGALLARPDGPRVVTIGFGGWDSHIDQIGEHGPLTRNLRRLDRSGASLNAPRARAFAASASPEEPLARYEAARKTRGTNVQVWPREEGRALQDPRIPRRTAADRGLLDYDPATAAV